tara:strand:- start:4226 stop:4696 length:471 start_codon:yes stop_codon:yes gene_type:complete
MRRTASSVLRDLEIRVANLEATTLHPSPSYFLDLVERVLPFRTNRDEDKIEFEGPNSTVLTIEFDDPSDLNNVRIDVSYDFHAKLLSGFHHQLGRPYIEQTMKKLFGRDTMFSDNDGEFTSTTFVNLQRKDLIEAKSIVKICTQAIKILQRMMRRD